MSTIKRRLHQSKHRGDDRRIFSLSQHPAKRRTLSRRQTCLQSREDFTRANTEVMIGGSSLFHNIQPREELSRRQTCLQSREDFTRANTEVMIGGSSLFHNIQPREEHPPGDRRVYNQEKTSPEQIQR